MTVMSNDVSLPPRINVITGLQLFPINLIGKHSHSLDYQVKNKKLQQEIDTMNDELDRWCQQLIEQEKSTIQQRRKFEEEKKSVNLFN